MAGVARFLTVRESWIENYISQLLETLQNGKCTDLLKAIFGVLTNIWIIVISTAGWKILPVTAGITKYKSIIKKKKQKLDERVLLAKIKLSSIEVLFPRLFNRLIYY